MEQIHLRLADDHDIPSILSLLEETVQTMSVPEWFVADDEKVICGGISEKGFTIIAESSDGRPAGFFLTLFPGLDKENMGTFLNLSEEELKKTAHMDTAVVSPAFRGNHLQQRMMTFAEEELAKRGFRYLLATVHPDNKYSLQNVLSLGYRIVCTREMYGGFLRHIVAKELPDA